MRGVVILIVILAVSAFFCGILPFVLMPSADIGVALPVVSVPGEKLWKDVGGSGFDITNTLIGTLLADIVVLAFAFGATRNLKEKPGRLQGMFEILTDALYGLAKSTAGKNAKKIFPLMATIFLFLLVANWWELVPGVDSIGLMHCAEEGFSGYESKDWVVGQVLEVDEPLKKGTRATHENYELCHHAEEGDGHHYVAHEIANDVVIRAAAAVLDAGSLSWKDDVGNENTLAAYIVETNQEPDPDAETAQGDEADDTGEHALTDEEAVAEVIELAGPMLVDAIEQAVAADELTEQEAAHALDHPEDLVADVLYTPYYRDDIYIVTPFVRAAATDLNLTLGLGLLAVVAIQFFGVQALGVGYFAKFINIPALNKLDKRPMGAMDFVVGLLELISELAKIVSFGFRLFGNIFAGQILLFVMAFLVAALLPAVFYGLELFVGFIQALVFAMLLLVFSSIAMTGHDHEDEHH